MPDIALQSAPNFDKLEFIKSGLITTSSVSVSDGGVGVWNNNSATDTTPHNLGFIPMVIAVIDDGAGNYWTTPFTSFGNTSSSSASISTVTVAADNTNIYIQTFILNLHGTPSLGPLNIKYYLFRTKGNE